MLMCSMRVSQGGKGSEGRVLDKIVFGIWLSWIKIPSTVLQWSVVANTSCVCIELVCIAMCSKPATCSSIHGCW